MKPPTTVTPVPPPAKNAAVRDIPVELLPLATWAISAPPNRPMPVASVAKVNGLTLASAGAGALLAIDAGSGLSGALLSSMLKSRAMRIDLDHAFVTLIASRFHDD